MTFFLLQEFATKDIVQKKQRVSLIVSYSFDTFMVFFKDGTYHHIDRCNRKVLKEGNLNFVPNSSLACKQKGRIVLLGCNQRNYLFCGVLDVFNGYTLFQREISNVKPQLTTKYYCYDYPSIETKDEIYLIMILKNIQNGITFSVFDMNNNLWCQQMLALNSRFLQCFFIQTSINNRRYFEQRDIDCYTFALVAVGERFDSVNYSNVKFYHDNTVEGLILKLKFIITREVKLKQHFVVMGGYQPHQNTLYLVGNSKIVIYSSQITSYKPANLVLNTLLLQNGEPQQVVVKLIILDEQEKSVEACNTFMIRNFLGQHKGNVFVMLTRNGKKTAIAKLNMKIQQLLLQLSTPKIVKLQLSCLKDCFSSYQSHCQQFFQKIKSAPSIINFTLLRLQSKQLQYTKLIKAVYPRLNNCMHNRILDML